MRQKKVRWSVVMGVLLCIAALAASILLQRTGYLAYLDSDMASELILARRQADTGSLIQMDWLYSTEIRIIQMNLLYALAFHFTQDYMWARIIGNTLGFALCMLSCLLLTRRLKLSWAKGLFTAAMLPVTASLIYAVNVTFGGYYITHMAFAFTGAALWLDACEGGREKKRNMAAIVLFAALCMLEGFLSVRYVLCFLCPMMAVAALDVLLAPQLSRTLRDHHLRFGFVTAAGFGACLAGYAAAEMICPHLFTSGVGSAGSFMFNPMDGELILSTMAAIFADMLRLIGWRGNAALFSLSGIGNACIAGVMVLGVMMTRRVYRALEDRDSASRAHKRMLDYAFAVLLVNVFCFVFIKGTYLNRYLILTVAFLIPAAAVVVSRERSMRLKLAFLLLLCLMLGTTSLNFLMETREQAHTAKADHADMTDMTQQLLDEGYTHGYGTFWHVRVMQELAQGNLTFAGINMTETEEGAVCPISLEMIRWLEAEDMSHMDVCADKTFVLLTRDEEKLLAPWLEMTGAPAICENGTYTAYGFEDSQQVNNWMMLARMKLENASYDQGVLHMDRHARMRIPTHFREAGRYVLRFVCEGEPAQESRAAVYTTKDFHVTGETAIVQGENELHVTLEHSDQYFMILLTSGEAQEIRILDLQLERIR
ncbi:MAG: hypothetical protein IKJ11_10650 [Clostridia bacterium]|nr:hypothetical protein [Clostridia bacterium]